MSEIAKELRRDIARPSWTANELIHKAADEIERLEKENERLERAAPVIAERDRQDAKWGYPQLHSLTEWQTILTEEVGELAAAILAYLQGTDERLELAWQKEAIQVAAVALAIVEQFPFTKAALREEEAT